MDPQSDTRPMPDPVPPAGPTMAQREHLVRRDQQEVLGRAAGNPRAASVGVLRGDMELMAHRFSDLVTRAVVADGPPTSDTSAVAEGMRTLGSVLRTFDRLSRLELALTRPAGRGSAGRENRGF